MLSNRILYLNFSRRQRKSKISIFPPKLIVLRGSFADVPSAKNKTDSILRARLGWGSSIARYQIETTPLPAKKSAAKKIFGTNLFLNSRLLVSTPTPPYASLREARQNFLGNENSVILVALFSSIRTHFTRNF
jgi:hypothetical protein